MAKIDTSAWYHNLALLQPAPYKPWRHSLRIAIGTGLPLLVGVLAGDIRSAIFVSLGAFLTAFTVRLDPYRERFLQIAISTAIAMLGCVIGPLVDGHGLMTLVMLVLVGLFSGLISGYGAAFSTGALSMLVLATVTSSIPHESQPWELGLQFLLGAVFVAMMLGLGALMDRSRPERHMMAGLLDALADLARCVASLPPDPDGETPASLEGKRRAVIDASKSAYDALIERRSHGRTRTRHVLQAADELSLVNQLTMSILAARASGEPLLEGAARLDAVAAAYAQGGPRPEFDTVPAQGGELVLLLDRLADAIWSPRQRLPETRDSAGTNAAPVFSRTPFNALLRRLLLGPEIIAAALRLSLCMGIAVVVSQFLSGNHTYWLPMTVAIVLKPDFGSVFVRGIHRSIGTLLGVGITSAIAALVHNSLGVVAVITLLCAFIPWAGLRSYAATVTLLTPVILLMISLVVPGSTESYAMERLIDTLLGASIALVFGYLIWPRSQTVQITAAFAKALAAVSEYLGAATAPVPQDQAALERFRQALGDSEFAAYRGLSDLRTQLQRLIAEPPPAGREAASWFPAVAGAERLCDRITTYAEGRRLGDPPPDEGRAAVALASVNWLAGEQREGGGPVAEPSARQRQDLFGDVEAEIAWLCDYRHQLMHASSPE